MSALTRVLLTPAVPGRPMRSPRLLFLLYRCAGGYCYRRSVAQQARSSGDLPAVSGRRARSEPGSLRLREVHSYHAGALLRGAQKSGLLFLQSRPVHPEMESQAGRKKEPERLGRRALLYAPYG